MTTTFSFDKQLEMGKEGEAMFNKLYGHVFEYNNSKDVKAPDFVHKETGAIVEVKYDDSVRAHRDKDGKQINFFVEQFSCADNMSLGGPFRAVEEGVDYFVYMFKEPFRIFIMDCQKFRDRAAELIYNGNYRESYIKNRGWYTSGYCLPIDRFSDCRIEGDVFAKGLKLNYN